MRTGLAPSSRSPAGRPASGSATVQPRTPTRSGSAMPSKQLRSDGVSTQFASARRMVARITSLITGPDSSWKSPNRPPSRCT